MKSNQNLLETYLPTYLPTYLLTYVRVVRVVTVVTVVSVMTVKLNLRQTLQPEIVNNNKKINKRFITNKKSVPIFL